MEHILFSEHIDTTSSAEYLAQCARDYDGHVREKALLRCAVLARGPLLAIAINRLNDWVPKVRLAAREAVAAILPSATALEIFATFEAVENLRRAKREDHSRWIDQYEKSVTSVIATEHLVKGVQNGDLLVSRACFGLLATHQLIDLATCIELGFARRDDLKTIRTAFHLCAKLQDGQRIAQYEKARGSHFGAVRVLAVRALLNDSATPNKTAVATAALMDRQSAVHSAAQFHLRQAGHDLRPYYAALLTPSASVEQLKMALMSMGNCGNRDDVAHITRFLNWPSTSVRSTALAAWLRLAPNDKDRVASTALQDTSPRIRRYARLIVQRHFAYVSRAEFIAALDRTGDIWLRKFI